MSRRTILTGPFNILESHLHPSIPHATRVPPLTAVNQAMTVGIEGFDQPEADLLLKYLYDIYERSTDI